jgi:hypothetical protein
MTAQTPAEPATSLAGWDKKVCDARAALAQACRLGADATKDTALQAVTEMTPLVRRAQQLLGGDDR